MDPVLSSTLLLTSLMGIGLGFFLRAASKDRTTTVDVNSSRPPVEVLDGLNHWLLARGWQASGCDCGLLWPALSGFGQLYPEQRFHESPGNIHSRESHS